MTNCHNNVIDIQTDYLQVLPKLNLNTLLDVDIFLLEAKSLIAVLTFLITEKNKTTKHYRLLIGGSTWGACLEIHRSRVQDAL